MEVSSHYILHKRDLSICDIVAAAKAAAASTND